jgi:hypothetical protein
MDPKSSCCSQQRSSATARVSPPSGRGRTTPTAGCWPRSQRLARHRHHGARELTRNKNYAVSYLFLKASALAQRCPLSDRFGAAAAGIPLQYRTMEDIATAALDEPNLCSGWLRQGPLGEPVTMAKAYRQAAADSFRLPGALQEPVHRILSLTLEDTRYLQHPVRPWSGASSASPWPRTIPSAPSPASAPSCAPASSPRSGTSASSPTTTPWPHTPASPGRPMAPPTRWIDVCLERVATGVGFAGGRPLPTDTRGPRRPRARPCPAGGAEGRPGTGGDRPR